MALLLQRYDFIHQQTCFKTTMAEPSDPSEALLHMRKKAPATLHTHVPASYLEAGTQLMSSLKGKHMLRDRASNTEVAIWFHSGVWAGEWGLFCFACRKFAMDYVKRICKLEKHSHNISAKERLLGVDYYLVNMWIIKTFNFWSMNSIYESYTRWKHAVLNWAPLLLTFSVAVFFFGGSCHFELV